MTLSERALSARALFLIGECELFAEMYVSIIREVALSHSPSSLPMLSRAWPRSTRPVDLYLNESKQEVTVMGHDLEPWYG